MSINIDGHIGILCHEIYMACIVNWMNAFSLVGLL